MTDLADKRLWTFIVRKGRPFRMQVPGNPILDHPGGLSVLKAVCTEERAKEIESICREHGCDVESKTELMDDEQRKRRQEILGVNRGDIVWPSEKCIECAFFDPHVTEYCGVEEWPEESVVTLSGTKKGRNDLLACPLGRGRDLTV